MHGSGKGLPVMAITAHTSVPSAGKVGGILSGNGSDSKIHKVPVGSLLPADSPRLAGLIQDHVQTLAESGADFEPILVHEDTGRVVDGMHRLQAAILRGGCDIAVRYVEGSPADLFVRSVEANICHGLPLTAKDRRAAVARILTSHPHWSDRAIAAVTGVSPKTVGAARKGVSSEEIPHSKSSAARIGRDGRLRSIDMSEQREKVRALLLEQPHLTLRDVAKEVGVSISTVHRIRQGLLSDLTAPLPDKSAPALSVTPSPEGGQALASGKGTAPQQGHLTPVPHVPGQQPHTPVPSQARFMDILSKDPALRFTDSGRTLLRWLNGQARGLAAGEQLLEAVPPHCVRAVAEVASQYAKEWERLASALQQRYTRTSLTHVPGADASD